MLSVRTTAFYWCTQFVSHEHKHRDHRLLSVYQMETLADWQLDSCAVQCVVVRLSLCCCQTSVEESVMKMEAAGCSETLVPTLQTIPAGTSTVLTHVFSDFPQPQPGWCYKIGHGRFLPRPFQFIHHSALHSLRLWQCRWMNCNGTNRLLSYPHAPLNWGADV